MSAISSRFQTDYVEKVTGYQVNFEKISRDTNADVICTVFETINTTGVKLTVFDLLVAKCYKNNIRLRDKLDEAVETCNNISYFDPNGSQIATIQLPRLIGLLHNGQCRKGDLLSLPVDAVRSNWDTAVGALDKFLGLLRNSFGCAKTDLIPSMDIITPLSIIYSDMKFNKQLHFDILRTLYWNLVFSLYLSGAPETKSARLVREWKDGGVAPTESTFEAIRTFNFAAEDMREATKVSSIYKGIMSLIISGGAVDFGKLRRVLNSAKHDIEDHHIFPQQFLRNSGIKGYIANGILNRTPIFSDTNKAIGSTAPEVYFSDEFLTGKIADEQNYLDGHAINGELARSEFSKKVFEDFCRDRTERILQMIAKATGQNLLTS